MNALWLMSIAAHGQRDWTKNWKKKQNKTKKRKARVKVPRVIIIAHRAWVVASKRPIELSSSSSASQPKQVKRQNLWLPFRNGNHSKRKNAKHYPGCAVISSRNMSNACGVRHAEDSKTITVLSTTWITGSTNQKLGNVFDHSLTDQHKSSMYM